MALFGAPIAHEDHAVRACYAALRMQESMRQYAEEVRRTDGIELQIRVGLNSGEVVVRSIGGDLRMDYSSANRELVSPASSFPEAHLHLDLDVCPLDAHRVRLNAARRRRSQHGTRLDVVDCPVPGAGDFAAGDFALGQRPTTVRAGVVDGVEGAIEIKEGDCLSRHLDALRLARSEIGRAHDSDELCHVKPPRGCGFGSLAVPLLDRGVQSVDGMHGRVIAPH